MTHTVLNGKDLILLLLYVPGYRGEKCEGIVGRTRIMKMIFLFRKEVWASFKFDKVIPEEYLPNFIPYDYGPFSTTVYSDIEFLKNLTFVTSGDEMLETTEEEALEYQWWLEEVDLGEQELSAYQAERFALTPKGRSFVEDILLGRLSMEQIRVLSAFKVRCTSVSLHTLLKYVYTKYKDYTSNSKIKEEIFRR